MVLLCYVQYLSSNADHQHTFVTVTGHHQVSILCADAYKEPTIGVCVCVCFIWSRCGCTTLEHNGALFDLVVSRRNKHLHHRQPWPSQPAVLFGCAEYGEYPFMSSAMVPGNGSIVAGDTQGTVWCLCYCTTG